MKLQLQQILIAIAYMAILVIVGLIASRKVKSSDDYWVGGRQVGPFATAISYCAAYYSTVAIVGAAPMYYTYGLGYASLELLGGTFLTGVVIFILFAPKIRAVSERVNAVSLPGFLAVRFRSNAIRLISAVIVAIFMVPYAVSVMKGIADALEQIAGVPYIAGVVVLAVVSLLYLITSGYWGVATTDIIQGLTITVAIVLLGCVTLRETNGLAPIIDNMVQNHPGHLQFPGTLSWGKLLSWSLVTAFAAFGQPQLVTKFMGLKDGRTVGTVVRTSVIWIALFGVFSHIVGVGALYIYRGQTFENIDMIAPHLAANYGGTLVAGIFLCGAIAAGLSTLVALSLSSSAAIAKDIYEDWRSERKGVKTDAAASVRVSRIATAAVLAIVTLSSLRPTSYVWFLSSMAVGVLSAAFTAPMILGLYWKRGTKQGCIAAMLGGAAGSTIWYLLGLSDIVHSFVPGTLLSFVLFFVVSLLTQPMDSDYVAIFFEKGRKYIPNSNK